MTQTIKEINETIKPARQVPRLTKSGKPACLTCGAMAIRPGSRYCFFCDPKVPQRAKELAQFDAKEAQKRRKLKLSKVVASASTASDLHSILATLICDLTSGRVSTKEPATVLLQAIKLQQTAIDATLKEQQLTRVEKKLEEAKAKAKAEGKA